MSFHGYGDAADEELRQGASPLPGFEHSCHPARSGNGIRFTDEGRQSLELELETGFGDRNASVVERQSVESGEDAVAERAHGRLGLSLYGVARRICG